MELGKCLLDSREQGCLGEDFLMHQRLVELPLYNLAEIHDFPVSKTEAEYDLPLCHVT
jgi:hypothetical protein